MRAKAILLMMTILAIGLAALPAGAITGSVPDGGQHPYVGLWFSTTLLERRSGVAPAPCWRRPFS